jgi:branched-chain amino acid aminotransferase
MSNLSLEKSTAFLKDSFVPFEKANISIASSPVLYGLSIYTVFPVNWNKERQSLVVFRLSDHYRRLIHSARIMDFHSFEANWNYDQFKQTVEELLRLNKVKESALVRVSVFIDELAAGTRIHDLKNGLCMYVYPLGQILPATGVNLCVSSWMRTPDNAIPSRAKINGSYINASLMKNEALLNGYDDAISLDSQGHVCESTVANIFIVKNNCLITPELSSDNLEGITRDTIIKLANDNKIDMIERCIDRSELYTCDEAFLCGSSAGVIPILSIDRRTVGRTIGPISQRIAASYLEVSHGINNKFKGWYDFIGEKI